MNGMMSTTVPMYLAECSPVNIRGRLVSLNIAMVACESPRWLIMSRQEEKARRVLQSMRGQLDIEDEYESIKMACVEVERDEQISIARHVGGGGGEDVGDCGVGMQGMVEMGACRGCGRWHAEVGGGGGMQGMWK
ncbi:MYCT-like protein [Mya arenaria]|uniref:MYCT-like protein n=1 Tax=Mya arenaria TaxID=6604 RepID=A0ABY7FZH8_MYAAR|nr:MYCT-like protein [Mya arenaria]